MREPLKEVIDPDDMAMLERVLNKLLPPNAEKDEREWLASILIGAFQSGMKGEAELSAHDAKTTKRH
ncbi:hypothetical protein EN873_24970 [bacterium M00.F.Ca.ET.230.01.1.1]|nr:hypothetical protein EN873_24970 [bacterium M00.F.Ca.ET.230.01.1.1]